MNDSYRNVNNNTNNLSDVSNIVPSNTNKNSNNYNRLKDIIKNSKSITQAIHLRITIRRNSS